MPSLPLSALTEYDAAGYNMGQSWMDVHTPPASVWVDARSEDADEHWDGVTDRLVKRYWAEAVLPIVLPAELEAMEAADKEILRRAMAAVAAARGTPAVVFDALRGLVMRDVEDGGE